MHARSVIELISAALNLVFLGIAALMDVKNKRIHIALIVIYAAAALIVTMFGAKSISQIVLGVSVGGILLIIGFLTKWKIGAADGLMLAILGISIGIDRVLIMFFITTLLAFVFAIALIIIKKVNKGKEIPLLPFMLGGYVITLICI